MPSIKNSISSINLFKCFIGELRLEGLLMIWRWSPTMVSSNLRLETISLREKFPNAELFLVWTQENTERKILHIWTLFTKCIGTWSVDYFVIYIPGTVLTKFKWCNGCCLHISRFIPSVSVSVSASCEEPEKNTHLYLV